MSEAPKKKGGRPRVAEPRHGVSTWIRVTDYDSLLKLAKKHETSLSAIVRHLIHLRIPRLDQE